MVRLPSLQVLNSLRDHAGSGESMMQLMYFDEGFTVDKAGKKCARLHL